MQVFKVVLVAIVLLVNLIIAPPSWAGQDHTKGADYAEVTQAIKQLLQVKDTPDQAGYTPEQFQQQLAQLQAQKDVMETTTTRAQCHNATTGTLAVYANKPKKSPTQLYFLGAGTETDDDWDCDGFYLPAGTQAVLAPHAEVQTLTEPLAVKFTDGTQSIARTNPATGAVEFNVAPAKMFKAGETNWTVPTLSQADISATPPTPQLID
ncbi:MAG: hypothetical protein KME27_28555 [Lyngbya sp. HA4199-MV5]|nr:hypothetical protein [Lyngbya sp. HA4199-MV5]